MISQPFEVCFIKTASQRSLRYTNILKIPFEIIKEEGFGKIMFGGLWPRVLYNILSTMILLNTYDSSINALV